MLEVIASKSFKKDLKKYEHRNDLIKELYNVIYHLSIEEPLPLSKKDHNLVGNYINFRECHVKNNLLLIYKVERSTSILSLVRFGSHSEVFN